jgi:hypothetical protein
MAGCGMRQYEDISQNTIDAMLVYLRSKGAATTGANPWTVEMSDFGVKLVGAWDADTMTLNITVEEVGWLVPCQAVWSTIDSMIAALRSKNIQPETA